LKGENLREKEEIRKRKIVWFENTRKEVIERKLAFHK